MVKKFLKILSIALIYCGAVFGAGFASGREIFTFFSCYKTAGILCSVFAGFLFSFFGFFVCGYAKTKNIINPEKYYEELFPKTVAKIVVFFINAFLVMSFASSDAAAYSFKYLFNDFTPILQPSVIKCAMV